MEDGHGCPSLAAKKALRREVLQLMGTGMILANGCTVQSVLAAQMTEIKEPDVLRYTSLQILFFFPPSFLCTQGSSFYVINDLVLKHPGL